MSTRPDKFYFCFTLDTEPDDLWVPQRKYLFTHFERLYAFHRQLADRGARPTYLSTSKVAENVAAARCMDRILSTGEAEIGAHFHTWTRDWPFNVPSLGDPPLQAMAHQLGQDTEERMLQYTCEALRKGFGVQPVSFRGGRWSLNEGSIRSLTNCGITVDSTVTPGRSWRDQSHRLVDGSDYRDFPRTPFYFREGSFTPHFDFGDLLEVPVGASFQAPRTVTRLPGLAGKIAKKVAHLVGRPKGWLWLRPTTMDQQQLSSCLHSLSDDGIPVWVAMIHSSEIIPCHKLPTQDEVTRFIERCCWLVEEAVALGAECVTLSELQQLYASESLVVSTSENTTPELANL